ncbi:MAG: nickel pincer cofactor biosynthesis protein LarC [Verrucomicrobia bacterium]|nr:nickel pincer cofactor biosynthesis protein LarC [Verrucomicrobiota bacterium]
MKLLYLDCFAGISGDMLLGALLDLGVREDHVRNELAKLPLHGYQIETRRVTKQHIVATKFDCITEHEHAHRSYSEIAAMIFHSKLPDGVKQRATNVFHSLGEVEARIHGIPLEKVHFHEIGAVDSIVDIVGVCIALKALGVQDVQAAPPPLGSGFVETAHGKFPIPAPATLELLKGVPTQSSPERCELVTPTGAALLVEFCKKFGPMPAMSVEKIGYGAGTRELEKTPNVLRAVLGVASTSEADTVAVIEANIDDMNPQWFGDVMERLLAEGALDAFLTPVQMKKSRPGTLLTVLCEPGDADRFAELVLTHTTSFGVRIHEARRRKLDREIVRVATRFGEIEVKIGRWNGQVVTRSPEYESCKRAAALANVPVREVYDAAKETT